MPICISISLLPSPPLRGRGEPELPGGFRLTRHGLYQRLDEEVIAPGDRFVHAETLVVMIDALHQDAFPLRPMSRQKAVGTQGLQDCRRGRLIALSVV